MEFILALTDILRFMVTIKLKHTTASQLFKRLSSYAKNHPLYKAIKEFGRIIKSIFILTYFDDIELRQRIEKQLNKVELSNKFSKAIFFSNNQEFKQGTKDEQEIIVACMILIQNAILLWNYLYVSQIVVNNTNAKERTRMIHSIKRGSMIAWGHVNLQGEYDFTKPAANNILSTWRNTSTKSRLRIFLYFLRNFWPAYAVGANNIRTFLKMRCLIILDTTDFK